VTQTPESENEAWVRSKGRRIAPVGYAFAAAGLALASSLVTLVFTLWPGLKPDPGERVGANVSVLNVEPAVRYEDWIRRTSVDRQEMRRRTRDYVRRVGIPGESIDAGTRQRILGVKGNVAYIGLMIEGFKRQNVFLRWSIYDAQSMRRLADRAFQDVRAFDVDLEAPSARSVVQLWIPPVPVKRKVFVRIELLSREGVLLAVANSAKFAGFIR